MVDLAVGGYLLNAFFEAGPSKPSPMGGELPLEWPDVWAYMQATQAIREPWEARALIEMSRAYTAEKSHTGVLRKPPIDRFCEKHKLNVADLLA